MHEKFDDLFQVAIPICNKILVLVWATCCKHQSIPVLLKQNLKEIALVLPKDKIQQVVDAGEEDWVEQCSQVVLDLAQAGPLGEALFACKVKDIVAAKLFESLTAKLTGCWDKAVTDKTRCGDAQLQD